jgi:hypothetical protein
MLNSEITSRQNKLILLGILLVASVLRFYNFSNLPLSHDEYSAILRTHYTCFNDLIELGVKPDFHPAGIQFFIFIWVKLFGTADWIVKLPFILFSISSVYLGYLVAKRWTNETIGLITASFLATSQYAVTYGTYARPYVSGLFFTLLLVIALTNFIQRPEHKPWKNWALFVIAGAACAYNHYVSMLIAGIIGLSAFPLVPKSIRLKYIFAGISIGILYLPHLPILSYHMSKGGVGGTDGWLGAPEPSFALEYIFYLFHYSKWSILLIIFILSVGWYWGRKTNYLPGFNAKTRIYLFLCWVMAPFLICYFYSVYKNPMLQFSALIFSHFVIYIFLFGYIKPLNSIRNTILVSAIILVNSLTLIFVREHYHVHYNIGYFEALEQLEKERKLHPRVPALIDIDERISDFLQKKRSFPLHFDEFNFTNHNTLIHYLDSVSLQNAYFYYVETTESRPEIIPIIQRYFPKVEKQINNQANTIYLFSKKGRKNHYTTIHQWIPSSELPGKWNNINKNNLVLTDGKWRYEIDSLTEWGPEITFDLKNIVATFNNYIDIEVETETLDNKDEIVITAVIKDGDSTVFWSGNSSTEQRSNGVCTTIGHSISVPKKEYIPKNQLGIMIWNKGKSSVLIKSVHIRFREGNKYRYSLLNPIYPTIISELKDLQHQ